jgi:endonuclease YncB( thermonuclease family)
VPARMLRLAMALGLLLAVLARPAAASAATGPCVPGGPTCHFWKGKVMFIADGDTIDVRVAGRVRPVRITGINAMELRRYSKYPSRRRGDCHGVAATNRLEQLLRQGGLRVRLAARTPSSRSGHRLRRQVSVRIGGQWVDVGRVLVGEGHALWLPNDVESAWSDDYRVLSEHARDAGLRLWNPRGCGAGPSPDAGLTMHLNWDADGNDGANVNGEWARISNPSGAPVSLQRWRFRDSALRRYSFPASATIPAGGSVLLRMGRGGAGGGVFHWGLSTPPFENHGDGAYLFDPRGNLRASVIYP